MTDDESEEYYARRTQQELDLAAAATDPAAKTIHLDLAARYPAARAGGASARRNSQ